MSLSLYNITNKFVELMDKAQEGELSEEEYNELGNELALELQNKSSNIIGYIKNSESLLEAMKTEEKRLSDIRKQGEKKLDKFYQYVKENMERLGLEEIPSEFKKEVTTTQVDKTAIKNHFKDTGEIVPGIRIINDKTSLKIK